MSDNDILGQLNKLIILFLLISAQLLYNSFHWTVTTQLSRCTMQALKFSMKKLFPKAQIALYINIKFALENK